MILAHAIEGVRVVVTRDCADFQTLAENIAGTSGTLLIFAGSVASAYTLVSEVGRIETFYPRMDGLVLSLVEFS